LAQAAATAPGEGGAAGETPVGGTGAYTIYYDGTGPLEVRIDIPLEEYQAMYFDGALWTPGVDYQVRSGSTILTIPDARLEAVADGSHIIRAAFARQSLDIPFTLDRADPINGIAPAGVPGPAAPAIEPSLEPESNAPFPLYAMLAVLAAAVIILRRFKARSHPRDTRR
jgi:hypothetical protein